MFIRAFKDKVFLKKMVTIALPIIIQQLLLTTFGIVDTVMVGSIDRGIAGVGLASQMSMIATTIVFGVNVGVGLYIAQFMGKVDHVNIKRSFALMLWLCFGVSLVFTYLGVFQGEAILRLFSQDPEAIGIANDYLKIAAFSYVPNMLTFSFAVAYRNIQKTKVPMAVSFRDDACQRDVQLFVDFRHRRVSRAWRPRRGDCDRAVNVHRIVVSHRVRHRVKTDLRATAAPFWRGAQEILQSTDFGADDSVCRQRIVFQRWIGAIHRHLQSIGDGRLRRVPHRRNHRQRYVRRRHGLVQRRRRDDRPATWDDPTSKQAKEYADNFLMLGIVIAATLGVDQRGFGQARWSQSSKTRIRRSIENAVAVMMVFGLRVALRVFVGLMFSIFRAGGRSKFVMFLDAGVMWLVGLAFGLCRPITILGITNIALLFLIIQIEPAIRIVISLIAYLKNTWQQNIVNLE
ncbi:MAG: MATE family efflux transporter [Bacillus subtilis]|nr:MATE family efflux transporter [Bacillus subtilis]